MRAKEVHREVIEKVIGYALELGFAVLHLDFSPIKGPEGNIEYLLHMKKNREKLPEAGTWVDGKEKPDMASKINGEGMLDMTGTINEVVEAAHAALDK